jgi:hypothetical protein
MTPNEQTNEYMAAHGCHFIVCSLCFLIVIIENLFLQAAHASPAQAVVYKTGPVVLSSFFLISHNGATHIAQTKMRNGFVLYVLFRGYFC